MNACVTAAIVSFFTGTNIMIEQVVTARSITLRRDSRSIIIRPLAQDDHAALLAFGTVLASDDLLYMEDDFENPALIMRLINAHAAENWRQLVAVTRNTIIGYAAVRRLPGWSNHVADVRVIVSAGWRSKDLSITLARAIL